METQTVMYITLAFTWYISYAIRNYTRVVQISPNMLILILKISPEVRLRDPPHFYFQVSLFDLFLFLGKSIPFSIVATPFYILIDSVKEL